PTSSMPTTTMSYELYFFPNDAGARLATRPSPTRRSAELTLAVSPTAVNVGGSVMVTVTGGPGSPTDWVGLYQQGAADPAYFPNWQYLNGTKTPPSPGLTSAALTFTMPTSPGMYEFRFFANDGFARLATSRAVTVNAAAPTLTVNVTA